MIDKIQFENYRAFSANQTLELKPITVIFGKNNSGKTAILKLPLIIESSLQGETDEVFLPKVNNGVELCTEYRDVVYGKATRAIKFEITDSTRSITLDYSFFIDTTQPLQTHREYCKLFADDKEVFTYIDTDKDRSGCKFKGIIPNNNDNTFFKDLCFQTDYIGSIRTVPGIDLRLDSSLSESETSGNDGANCYQYLIRDSLKPNADVLQKVSGWYQKNFDNWGISIDKKGAPVYHVVMRNGEMLNNIIDTGFGIIQSLPIVVRAARKCEKPTLVILEEPESHLHPAAHASLGELIANSALEDKNKRYLIETHSQNLLLRLRRLVAEKKISKDDVAFYYVSFDKEALSSSLNKILINENGLIDKSTPWPSGVFEESLQEVIGIRDAQN